MMKKTCRTVTAVTLAAVALGGLAACGGGNDSPSSTPFNAKTLGSDGSGAAPHHDPNLQNGWGITRSAKSTFWVSDNNTHKATLYDGNGVVQPLVVTIPDGANGPSGPTGIISNATTDFVISANGKSSSAAFIWATDSGTIAAWSPNVLPTQAVTAFDDMAGAATLPGAPT